jgi:small GTP-binding protein
MSKETIKIAITGHVDHGKSTTIGRILLETRSLPEDKLKELQKISREFGKDTELAYLADQLKEEREKNLTIDTTEIPFKTKLRDYCLIDTPGHLEFIKNMLTGASHADAAILIIDVSEGVQEQTRRHAYLLKLLSLNNIIILLNKMDMLNYSRNSFLKIKADITNFFHSLGIPYNHFIPISAKENINITRPSRFTPWYRGPTLIQAIDRIRMISGKTVQSLRFPIQDAYHIAGENIAVGRIASGILKTNDTVMLFPQKQAVRVKAIKVFGKTKSSAQEGESVGVVLDSSLSPQRGNMICAKETLRKLPAAFKGNIFWMSDEPLKKGECITLRCATQEIGCEVKMINQRIDPASLDIVAEDAPTLQKNEAGIIQFVLTCPAVLELFSEIPELGRFTLERNRRLQGAGTVIERILE